jgi:hypothetical protein
MPQSTTVMETAQGSVRRSSRSPRVKFSSIAIRSQMMVKGQTGRFFLPQWSPCENTSDPAVCRGCLRSTRGCTGGCGGRVLTLRENTLKKGTFSLFSRPALAGKPGIKKNGWSGSRDRCRDGLCGCRAGHVQNQVRYFF